MVQQNPSMPPPANSSPSIPIDPALAMYPPYFAQPNYQQGHHLHQHLPMPPNYSSPSSQASESVVGTPPTDPMYSPALNGKRPASSISNTGGDLKKKARKDDVTDVHSPAGERDEAKPKPTRGSRACTVCRRLKMKCVGAEQGPPCKRCAAGNHECIFEESNRGKRSSNDRKHELLTRSLRKMEKTLDTVLRSIGNPGIASGMVSRSPSPTTQNANAQAMLGPSPSPPPASYAQEQIASPKLHSLPDNSLNPLGLLAEASLANRRAQGVYANAGLMAHSTDPNEKPKVGVASANYFKPGPMTILPLRRLFIERQIQPEMLNFVSTEEVVALFNIYFDNMNIQCHLLDKDFHTPSLICSRSPFLLTTICSIASKYYTAKPDLHNRLTELANKLAFNVPAKGYKSVEIVQAYMLLALYGCGAVERYEQDKTWLLLGMAIRMAIDLNLHRKTSVPSQDTPEGRARDIEVHNRERTWILLFSLDRSFSNQMGKPYCVKEDNIIRNALQWANSPVAAPSDMSIASYSELQRILSRSLDFLYSGTDSISGLQAHCDYLLVIKTFEAQILAWRQFWQRLRPWEGELPNVSEYKQLISQFYFNYAMLIVNSFGLQNALERSAIDIGHFFARCHSSATTCAVLVRDHLGPKGFLRYTPDSHCVMISYAVLTLLKLIRPEFQTFHDNEQGTHQIVQDVADTLEKSAANPQHTPALYSVFLRALISARLDPIEASAATREDIDKDHGVSSRDMPPPHMPTVQHPLPYPNDASFIPEFQFESEMGPVADMSTFPPTMAPLPTEDTSSAGVTMDNILSNGFWDNVLIPGYNSMDGITGGFVFGMNGSGLITPWLGGSPSHSGANSPGRSVGIGQNQLAQLSFNAVFNDIQIQQPVKMATSC
ncbi:Fungal specific transcription factor domain containing protein [Amanita muscaria]